MILNSAVAQNSTRDVLREITDVVGLKPRFELQATSQVQNAAAVVYNGKRFLLYNPQFVASVNRAGRTDWAGISILAHEMGHHLNGHTLRPGGSQPADELEADEFSGFVLRKMGASLAEAQAGMAVVSDEEASPTHPGRSTRLSAISKGWQQANTQIAASRRATAPSAAPVAIASTPTPVRTVANSAVPMNVVGQIVFRDNPQQRYYLTSKLNVVRMQNKSTGQVVGRVTRSTSSDFPFILVDGQDRRLYISANGGCSTTRASRSACFPTRHNFCSERVQKPASPGAGLFLFHPICHRPLAHILPRASFAGSTALSATNAYLSFFAG
ncbi:membrane-binding protein [Hymenobacter cellulosilyticus]|uniref:Membrane-binding protein n=1 Tax=Hymenobacter cellulosilyticus TaxID=2932248 RepID=A0A8T9Q2X1_9BACT|nr:membrane-binding protein [Hymenobacter cellulosilyticus]UOQ71312.1 membrane-binding protein [Hymenobacter cellulosilyticus]